MESSRKPASRIDEHGRRQLAPPARRRDRAALEELVIAIGAAVARLNAEAPTGHQHRRPLLLAEELARYDEACRR